MSAAGAITGHSLQPDGFAINSGSLLLTTLAINILSIALPVMTLQIYDRILPNPGSGTLPILITGVCIAIALETILRLIRAYSYCWSGAAYEHRLSCQTMKHLLNADLSQLGPMGIGENLGRMTAIGKLKDFYNGYALVTAFELLFVPVFLGVIIYIAGPVALIPTVILSVFLLVSLGQGRKMRDSLKERDNSDDIRYNFLIEGLEGIHTLKSFSLENTFARRYETLEEKSTIANYHVTETTSSVFNTGATFSHLMAAAVISAGAFFVLQGQITTGALIASVLLAGRMMQPVQRALALWAKYQDYTLARERIQTVFDIPLFAPAVAPLEIVNNQGKLTLNNVGFRHHEEGAWLLKHINLTLDFGDSVLLSGVHGSGKTNLLEMIAGIYPSKQGEIIVNDGNILRYTPEQLTQQIGYIQTDGTIFRGTIRDNVTCFGQIPEDKVREIASLLKVDRDIARLPSGFDTFLSGNKTDSISPGLKQRIAMVRVLAQKPRLILFDNADRALDREGYNLVYSLLARLKGKATFILVSDDYNIRSLAEKFYVIKDGMLEPDSKNISADHVQPYRELQI